MTHLLLPEERHLPWLHTRGLLKVAPHGVVHVDVVGFVPLTIKKTIKISSFIFINNYLFLSTPPHDVVAEHIPAFEIVNVVSFVPLTIKKIM